MINNKFDNSCKNEYRCGEIYYADLNGGQGSEQRGVRPVLIVQNNVGNRHSPTTIILPITSKIYRGDLPTHVVISPQDSGLQRVSMVQAEQIRTVDKLRLKNRIGCLSQKYMQQVFNAMLISCGIFDNEAECVLENMVVAV